MPKKKLPASVPAPKNKKLSKVKMLRITEDAKDNIVAGPVPVAHRAVVERADGSKVRRSTIYLPVELARRLSVHAAEHDLDVSAVVAAAVEVYLDRR